MRSIHKWLALLATAVLMSACGGGGGSAGAPIFGGDNPTLKASDLTLSLDEVELPNNGQTTIRATATAVDANRNALAGIPISISVDSNAVAAVSGATTDAKGTVTADIGIGSDKSNRVVTVTAVAPTADGTISRTATFQISGATLSGTAVPAVLRPGEAGDVQYRLTDKNSNPMAGLEIVVIGPGGVETRGTTGTNGDFTFEYVAPSTPGVLEFRATAGGATVTPTASVIAATNTIPAATLTVRSASVSANPSVVPVNTVSTDNRSELRALFVGDNNVPVQNIRVRFDLPDAASQAIGGTFRSGPHLVYSDAGGVAATAYIPGSRSSPTDGVTIRACWDYNDFEAPACPNQVTKTLTVVSEPLSVSIGTDSKIEIVGQSYVKRFVVQVVDASGLAKADVQITPSVDLLRYLKGQWVISGDIWVQAGDANGDGSVWINPAPGIFILDGVVECDNEDLNRNGVDEVFSNGHIEDANNSKALVPTRPALDPRKADVAVFIENNGRTGTNGTVSLSIQYPQNVASWVEYNLLVAASGVSGTEGRANFQGVLPVLAAHVTDVKADPPFRLSPYGIEFSPVVFTETTSNLADPSRRFGSLCTNPD